MSEPQLVYKSKIHRIRGFALALVFAGMIVMYIGVFLRKTPWLMITFFVLGVILILLSTVVYFWIGMLSTRAIPIICPTCERPTKMLGRVDACMHCKQALTLDKNLEGVEFDEKYNSRREMRKIRKMKQEDMGNE